MISVSIVNVTSYTGLELLRLIAQHPEFRVTSVTARSSAGQRLDAVFPQLAAGLNHASANMGSLVLTEKAEKTDLAFVCLPHAAAAETVADLLAQGTRVVDLSADFRLEDVAEYEAWYQHKHPVPALVETAVFGLPERYRERIAGSSLVANPGCHSSTAILALLPAVSRGLIKPDIMVSTLTGISGAGRGLKLSSLFCEQDEDVSPYSLGGHRHLPEIVQELEAGMRDSGRSIEGGLRLTFVPHLIPMSRGLLATCSADLLDPAISIEEIRAVYAEYYANEPFIRVLETAPHTRWATGTNLCLIHPTLDQRAGRFMVFSCLDNLVKGASGAAIQNANLVMGLPETTGLPVAPLVP